MIYPPSKTKGLSSKMKRVRETDYNYKLSPDVRGIDDVTWPRLLPATVPVIVESRHLGQRRRRRGFPSRQSSGTSHRWQNRGDLSPKSRMSQSSGKWIFVVQLIFASSFFSFFSFVHSSFHMPVTEINIFWHVQISISMIPSSLIFYLFEIYYVIIVSRSKKKEKKKMKH